MSYVYCIQAGFRGPIKIGWAKNPRLRMATFQTGHFSELRLLAYCRGSLLDEQDIHRKLREMQDIGIVTRGEWYEWEDNMVVIPWAMELLTHVNGDCSAIGCPMCWLMDRYPVTDERLGLRAAQMWEAAGPVNA